MTAVPWLGLTLLLPLFGALCIRPIRQPMLAARWCLGIMIATLVLAVAAALLPSITRFDPVFFQVDGIAQPMLPALALLHLLVILGTAKSRVTPAFCSRVLLSAGISIAAVTCTSQPGIVVLMAVAALLPLRDLQSRRARVRGYLFYLAPVIIVLAASWAAAGEVPADWSVGLMLLAILFYAGIAPAHGWVSGLFRSGSFGSAMLFLLPVIPVAATLRFVLPEAPEWMLDIGGIACLVTALYAGALTVVQHEARRFYAYLCLSQTALILFAAMLNTSAGITAALCLWISTIVSLAGLAFAIRALEARFGPLSLREHHGHYNQAPGLAICFIVAGLSSVGFPVTLGFVPMELLISSSFDQGIWTSMTAAAVAMLNGMAILRAYFALFTGKRSKTSVSLQVTNVERAGVSIVLVVLIVGGWFWPSLAASRHQLADRLVVDGRQSEAR